MLNFQKFFWKDNIMEIKFYLMCLILDKNFCKLSIYCSFCVKTLKFLSQSLFTVLMLANVFVLIRFV